MNSKRITKIFIANRGEIVRRIAITAKKLGLQTCTISSKTPLPSYLQGLIDDVALVQSENIELFLNADELIKLALTHNCDSIHPGVGFLAENAYFAQKCLDNNLLWIGPNPKSIATMADKHISKIVAQQCNIPSLPTSDSFVPQNLDNVKWQEIYEFCNHIGMPLIIKASLGGGGKGMQIIWNIKDLKTACLQTSNQAQKTCSDPHIIIEKYLINPRHVEVQVVADKHGNVVALSDRECSIQRRYQKIIEEAPATCLTDALRQQLYDAATKLAKYINYDSLGTVEFLIDTTAEKSSFYFLEMNTRLQVEHTITEEILNIDLVELQIKIAQQESIELMPYILHKPLNNLHSIQARIYAEDPEYNFLPSAGYVYCFEPCSMPNIRWEIGIDTHDYIHPEFDPMIAKCIVTASERHHAINLLKLALQNTAIIGIKTNVPYLISMMDNSSFLHNDIHTQFVTNTHHQILKTSAHYAGLLEKEAADILKYLKLYEFSFQDKQINLQQITEKVFSFHKNDKYKKFDKHFSDIVINNALKIIQINETTTLKTGYGYKKISYLKDQNYKKFYFVLLNKNFHIKYFINLNGYTFEYDDTAQNNFVENVDVKNIQIVPNQIIAPLPGKIISINIQKGQNVTDGQLLFVIESMKMQFEIKAHKSGVVNNINVNYNDLVETGTFLAELV